MANTQQQQNNGTLPQLPDPLTPREVEILYLLFDFDLDVSEMACKLCISKHTLNFHINNIIGKLSASSRADAVCRYARLDKEYRAAFVLSLLPLPS